MRIPRHVSDAVAAVPPPQPFDLDVYLQRVQESRGRRLFLHDLPLAAVHAVCGLWLATEKADHIYVAPGASGILRTTIVLHEVSHMLLGHGQVQGDAAAVLAGVLASGERGQVQTALARSRYDAPMERDAETLALLILHHAGQPVRDEGDGLRMLGEVMGHPIGEGQ